MAPEPAFNVEAIRKDFPILQQEFNGKPLVYLDSAATSQKPKTVIDAHHKYWSELNGTVRRGVYHLSEKSTFLFDETRKKVAKFLNAKQNEEIVFTSGCTASLNLLAYSLGTMLLKPQDEVIISAMEHHANIVPWQIACQGHGAVLKVAPIDSKGELILEEFEKLLSPKTKIVSIMHVSNVLGTVNPIKLIAQKVHQTGAVLVVDGAQAVSHQAVDVQDLDCDFYCFSGHKLYGPTGVGVLYGKYNLLEKMPPFMSGGDMIDKVSFEKTTYALPPARFEAGTPAIAEVITLSTAIEYVQNIGFEAIGKHETFLLDYCTQHLAELPGLKIIGQASNKAGVISFVLNSAHAHDLGTILDHEDNICIRVGHHCAQPLMQKYNVTATCRASFAIFNNTEEIDKLVNAIKKALSLLA